MSALVISITADVQASAAHPADLTPEQREFLASALTDPDDRSKT